MYAQSEPAGPWSFRSGLTRIIIGVKIPLRCSKYEEAM